ncbi:hypothetical protein [Pseudomonas paralcaligenes]|uniref:hypothetical protein n=1 Tax=Pseudomonas paralcaligenes TaxID=2772558 RepID=UPI001C826B04|nr:hypothetical protein [Pseudomonas paralcaligenes]
MSLHAWLRGLTEETLVGWANRGLVRRARKLLEDQAPTGWLLEEARAEAGLEGYRQQLDGVGFEHLRCSCPAFGVCHHQLGLLLGLSERLAAGAETAPLAPELEAGEPWLIDDAGERERLLGRASITKARRWRAQGAEAQWVIDERQLSATLADPEVATLMIPRAGGLPASLCSCRESRCAHRALVVLQLVEPAEPEAEALSDAQRQALAALDGWLEELAAIGMSGGSSLFVARGQALATELLQADLPLPGRLLARLAGLLDDERQGMAASQVRQVRRQLAELLAHRRALARVPLPQPLSRLAGLHRQKFAACENLRLLCLSAECWETAGGYRGYRLHFVSPGDHRCYSLSESRSLALHPGWSAEGALAQAMLADQPAVKLLGMECLLERGWVSEDGRLSARAGTRLRVIGPWPREALPALVDASAARLLRIAEHRQAWLYRSDPQPWGLVSARLLKAPVFERLGQRWLGEAISEDGYRFPLVMAAGAGCPRAARILAAAEGENVLLFGRWVVEGDAPLFSPVALFDARGRHHLFSEVR